MVETIAYPPEAKNFPIYDHWSKAAKRIYNSLKTHRDAGPFQRPVIEDFSDINYLEVIKTPMDLRTIGEKLKKGYLKAEEFESDVRLILTNCLAFNGDDDLIYTPRARSLIAHFEEQAQQLQWSFYIQ